MFIEKTEDGRWKNSKSIFDLNIKHFGAFFISGVSPDLPQGIYG
jgi:hypothetical protein